MIGVLEFVLSRTAGAMSRKDNSSGEVIGTRVRCIGIECRVSVLALGASKLVIETEPERQSQFTRGFELVIDPWGDICFVEHRVEG